MRLILTAIAVISLVGCERTDNVVDQTQVASNMPIFDDENACQSIDDLVDDLLSAQATYGPDHPDLRKFESLILNQVQGCNYPGQSVALPDDAPPNSRAFSFNGHTYVVVPLNSIGDQAQPSK